MSANKSNSEIHKHLLLRVLKRIEQHRKDNPIKGSALALELGVDWRKVAGCVEELRDAGFKIGSSNQTPAGYYLVTEPVEMLETVTRMRDQARKIFARTNRMMDFGQQQPTIWETPVDAGHIHL